jgi:hypothetical protein
LHFGTRIWESATTATTDNNHVRTAQDTVSGQVENIYPFFRVSPSDRYVQFDGEPTSITFFARTQSKEGGLDQVTIQLNADGTLSLDTSPELAVPGMATVHRILLRGVRSLDVAYFGAQSRNAASQWYGTWHNAPMLPTLVRVRATLTSHTAKWPDLVVTPYLSVDQSCVYSLLSKYCAGRI